MIDESKFKELLPDPEPSERFVQKVMQNIIDKDQSRLDYFADYIGLSQWLSAACCVLLIAIIVKVNEPLENTSTEALLLSEVADESLFMTFAVSDYKETKIRR